MNFLIKVLTVLLVVTTSHCAYKKYTEFSESELNTYVIDNLPDYDTTQITVGTGSPLVSIRNGKGHISCSGTVITDDYILTAAHCLMDHDSFSPGLSKDEIYIMDATEVNTSSGRAAALNQRSDVALIKGNFKQFAKAKLMLKAQDLLEMQGPFVTCGFPRGEKATCLPAANFRLYGDFLLGSGLMFFCMSGGPAVDMSTGTVFAVNSAVTDGIIVAPVVGLFQMFNIKVITQQ